MVFVVNSVPIDKDNSVSVLLNLPRVSEVRENGALVLSELAASI